MIIRNYSLLHFLNNLKFQNGLLNEYSSVCVRAYTCITHVCLVLSVFCLVRKYAGLMTLSSTTGLPFEQ